MKPFLFLSICIVIVFYLLAREEKNSGHLSKALWIPTIWFLILSSRALTYWLNVSSFYNESDALIEGNIINQIVLGGLTLAALKVVISRKKMCIKILFGNKYFIFFWIYWGISIFWSEYPFVALKRYFRAIGDILMVLIVLTELNSIEAIKKILMRTAIIHLPFSIILYKYFPLIGRKYHRWTGELSIVGVTTNKNSLGLLCLFISLYLFWEIVTNYRNKHNYKIKMEHIMLFIMSIYLLFKSNSATSQICFLIGIILITYSGSINLRYSIDKISYFILFTFISLIVLQLNFNIIDPVAKFVGRDPTLTGRTILWKELIEDFNSPIFGVGFCSFWLGQRVDRLWEKYWWKPTEAHNGYLETYLNGGIVGLLLLLFLIFYSIKILRTEIYKDQNFGALCFSLFFVIIIYNISESAYGHFHIVSFVFWLCIFEKGSNIHLNNNNTFKRVIAVIKGYFASDIV